MFPLRAAVMLAFGVLCAAVAMPSHSDAVGVITTVAGGGAGNGGIAVAQSVYPFSVTVDSAGNLYVAELTEHRVRFVDMAAGTMSTYAGGGSGCGASLGDGGPATSACLSMPVRTALDGSGNLFI